MKIKQIMNADNWWVKTFFDKDSYDGIGSAITYERVVCFAIIEGDSKDIIVPILEGDYFNNKIKDNDIELDGLSANSYLMFSFVDLNLNRLSESIKYELKHNYIKDEIKNNYIDECYLD